VYEHF